MRLPKDAVAYFLQQTDRTRKQVLRLLEREVKTVLARVDWPREARRLMRGMRLEVRAEVRFLPGRRRARRRPREEEAPPNDPPRQR